MQFILQVFRQLTYGGPQFRRVYCETVPFTANETVGVVPHSLKLVERCVWAKCRENF
jgi:hypothetical protein